MRLSICEYYDSINAIRIILKVYMPLACYPLYSKVSMLLPKSGYVHICIKVTVELCHEQVWIIHKHPHYLADCP